MASIPVKWFDHTLTGIPRVNNTWGALTTMLDAVLVNGFNIKAITAIARVGDVATAYSVGHGYVQDQVVAVSGWDQPEYNGEFRVISMSADTYDFVISGSPVTPGTGTGTAKAAPLGFEIAFTGTNKRAYRSPNPASNRPYLRVDDSMPVGFTTTWGKSARVTMAEGMTGIDTFVGARAPYDPNAPTQNEVPVGTGSGTYAGWFKWYYSWNGIGSAANAGDGGDYARNWNIAGDNQGFLFFINSLPSSNLPRSAYGFGDFPSFRAADGFNTYLFAADRYVTASGESMYPGYGSNFTYTLVDSGKVAMRDYTQFGLPTGVSFTCLNVNNSTMVSGNAAYMPFPSGPDYSLLLLPLVLRESRRGDFRGTMPGLYFTPQLRPYEDGTVVDNVTGQNGKKFRCVAVGHDSLYGFADTGRVFVDIIGPWR